MDSSTNAPTKQALLAGASTVALNVYITMSDPGGVGKSLAADLVNLAHLRAGIPVDLCEWDSAKPLSQLYPQRVQSNDVGPQMIELLKNPKESMRFLAPIFQSWIRPARVQIHDLGSPMARPVLNMAPRLGITEEMGNGGAHLRLLVCTTTDIAAAASAMRVHKEVRAIWPKAQIALVVSERQGEIAMLERSPAFREARTASNTRVVVIPRCDGTLFGPLYGNARISFPQIEKLSIEGIQKLVKEDRLTIKFYRDDLLRIWLPAAIEAFGDFIPQPR
jgi:hypothetical protein